MGTLPSRKTTKRIRKRAPRTPSPSAERYTPRRLAQFLLENAAARREVRKLGLDPDQIPHEPPSRA
jgi:hypothetical protein